MSQRLYWLPRWLGLVLVAGCFVGCQRADVDDCPDGSCCYPGETNQFVRRLTGERAGVLGTGFIFKQPLGPSAYGPIFSCQSCPAQTDELVARNLEDNMATNFAFDATGRVYLIDSTRAYPYRVWGTLYELTQVAKLTSAPVYVFRLEKAEKIN